jgi:hypothetical protein
MRSKMLQVLNARLALIAVSRAFCLLWCFSRGDGLAPLA